MTETGTGKEEKTSTGNAPLASMRDKEMAWFPWALGMTGVLVVCFCTVLGAVLFSGRSGSPISLGVLPIENLGIGSTWERPTDGMIMVYVPQGEFTMGSDGTFYDRLTYFSEIPAHPVFLDAYWIDQTEVTNAMYFLCVSDEVCNPPGEVSSFTRDVYYGDPASTSYPDYPVIYVDAFDAAAYCEWAGGLLPTEAQWEKAARGTDERIYPWGNEAPSCSLANFYNPDEGSCVGDTSRVGSYPLGASPYGVMDMAGNVTEWAADWLGDYPRTLVYNPVGSTSGEMRTIRGGSWDYHEDALHTSNRRFSVPYARDNYIGFRCVIPQPLPDKKE